MEMFLMILRFVLPLFSLMILVSHPEQYGVSVSESSVEIRQAFVRKVYSILCEFTLLL
jgi:hypothetical protein